VRRPWGLPYPSAHRQRRIRALYTAPINTSHVDHQQKSQGRNKPKERKEETSGIGGWKKGQPSMNDYQQNHGVETKRNETKVVIYDKAGDN